MQLEPGDLVRLKRDPVRAGVLQDAEKNIAGQRMVTVRFSDGQMSWLPYSALEHVPENGESCYDRFVNGKFVSPDWLRRTLTRLRVSGRLSEVVYSMEATETDFYPHQFKPVIKLMESPTDSLLIADEVGLGKTIEAGLIWTELRARHDCNRLLVACPKTLCEKWQLELGSKFGVDVQLANASTLLKILRRSKETGAGFALVCSMQGLRPPRGWDKLEETERDKQGVRVELARFLSDESDGEPLVDLLVFDEAHHMRNPSTMLNAIGNLTSGVSSHRLFLSATPIHLQNRDLHSILKMVDPDTFEYANTLNELIDVNAPLVKARDLLLKKGTKQDIEEHLVQAQQHELLCESKTLGQILSRLNSQPLDTTLRSELAVRLEHVNQLANYVNRTRRRDVKLKRVFRDPSTPTFTMNEYEQRFYEEISAVVNEYAESKNANELFLLSMPQRLLTSSLAAASAYWATILPNSTLEGIEETDTDLDEETSNARPLVTKIAKRTRELGLTKLLQENDTKFQSLLDELNQLWCKEPHKKVIIFSSFKPTLKYLQSRLTDNAIRTELLHGSISEPRSTVLERFEQHQLTPILLSSEIGSEGVDLQFCSTIVNYDIPWNPMRLEQRIGRIDRLGQKSEKIQVLNLVFDNTIDSRIFHRLYDRLTTSEKVLGEMEAILGRQIREMTTKLLDPRLTDRQKEALIDETAQALETQREQTDRLESEAGSLVQHGDYILERIYESRNNRRWLNRQDVLVYVKDRLEQSFPGTIIESSPPSSDKFKISFSNDGFSALSYYLSKHNLNGSTRILADDARQRFVFTESVVQKSGRVEQISQLHPLVRFCVDIDQKDISNREAQAIAAVIDGLDSTGKLDQGVYVVAINRWSSNNNTSDAHTNTRIGYIGANVETGELISSNYAEAIANEVSDNKPPMVNPSSHRLFKQAATLLGDVVLPEADKQFETFFLQTTAEVEDRLNIRLRALEKHFERKFETLYRIKADLIQNAASAESANDLQRASNLRNLVLARTAQISKLEKILQARRHEIEQQRSPIPEVADISLLLVEVRC